MRTRPTVTTPIPSANRLAIAGILAFGVALRTIQYAAQGSMWMDELAIAINVSERGPWELLFQPLDLRQVAPPGFLLLEKLGTELLGAGEAGLRLFPWLASLASLFLFWRVAARFASPAAVVAGLLAFAASPSLVWYAGTAKQYSGDVAVTLLLVLLALRSEEERWSVGRAILWGLAGGAAILASQPAVLVAAALGAVLLARRLWDRAPIAPIVALAGGWAIGAAAVTAHSLRVIPPAVRGYMAGEWNESVPAGSVGRAGPAPVGPKPAPLEPVPPSDPRAPQVHPGDPLRRLDRRPRGRGRPPPGGASPRRGHPPGRAPGRGLSRRGAPPHAALQPAGDVLHAFAPAGRGGGHRRGPGAIPRSDAGRRDRADPRSVRPSRDRGRRLRAPSLPGRGDSPVLEELRARLEPGDAIYVYYAAGLAMRFYAPDIEGVLGANHRADGRGYFRQLDELRGRPRVWFFHTHGYPCEPDAIRSYLEAIGIELDRIEDPYGLNGQRESAAYLSTSVTRDAWRAPTPRRTPTLPRMHGVAHARVRLQPEPVEAPVAVGAAIRSQAADQSDGCSTISARRIQSRSGNSRER